MKQRKYSKNDATSSELTSGVRATPTLPRKSGGRRGECTFGIRVLKPGEED